MKGLRFIILGLVALSLVGCGATDLLRNPLEPKKRPVPGQREDIMQVADAASGTANISGSVNMGDWSQPGGNAANNPGHVTAGGTSRAWRTSIGAGSGKKQRLSTAPVMQGGVIFTIDSEGTVVASNASSGGRIWRSSIVPEGEKAGDLVGGGLAVSGNGLFITSPYGSVIALEASSGQQIWKKDLPIALRGAPTVADGKVFASDRNNTVYALNIADGEIAWEFATIPEAAGVLGSASPAYAGGRVVVPLSSGDVVAMDNKGQPVWTDSLSKTGRYAGFASLQDVSARPVIADGIVYSVGVSGRMLAVRLSDGNRLWSADVASAYMPVVSGNAIFAVTIDGRVVAVNKATGELIWSNQLPTGTKKKRISYAGPLLAGGRLYVGTSEGQLLSFEPTNGQAAGSTTIGEPIFIAPIAVGGRIFVLGDKGSLIALQ